ncbi:MAG: cdhA 1 [Hyphomicrobiales bacterium]|nr:cdhA 1 [Hyphomicrobiales bacterium]
MGSLIGSRTPRIEDRPLLTGNGQFLDDISIPGILHVCFVRSQHAHALIRSIALDEARAMPGVHAVLTMADLIKVTGVERMPLGASPTKATGPITPYILSNTEVAFVGETIAMVVAESRYAAEDAAGCVIVDYEPLPVVTDIRAAVASNDLTVRQEASTNVLNRLKVAYGDAASAFATAKHVFREELWQHRGCAHPMETRGVVAECRPDRGLNVWSSTQMPNDLFTAIAEATRLEEDSLRVITPDVGGGFGPKYCIYPEEIAVAAAALLLRRSLKWVEDRREHCMTAVQERDQYWTLEIAVDGEGLISGIRGNLIHDQGAYALKAVNLPYNSATAVPGPYIVPHYEVDVIIGFTNKVPASSVRGAGYPQAAFAMERLMDRVARELGVGRVEIRRRNLIPPEKMPYSKPLKARSGAGITYDSGDYIASQAEVLAAADWDGFAKRQADARKQGRYLGIGLAHAVKGTGRGPFETGMVRVNPSGQISIYTGAAAMGQGLGTALAQICADQLGVRADQITVTSGDTARTPLGLGGFASRQLVTAGSSVLLSSRAVAAKAKKLASHMLEASEDDLELADGKVRVIGAPDLAVSLGELSRILRGAPGYAFPPGIEPSLEADIKWQTEPLAYANTSHVVEVEVDPDLAHVTILRYTALQDCGTLINPMIVDGQIRGGIAHGIGNALLEEMIYDANGQPLTTTFADYLLPTSTDVPNFQTIYRQTPSPINPLGAKGVGEVGTIPAAAAIISAIEDALSPFHVRISQTPVTPQVLFRLIAEARA